MHASPGQWNNIVSILSKGKNSLPFAIDANHPWASTISTLCPSEDTHIYIYTYIRATIKLQSVQRHVTWNAPRTAFFHRAPLFWHPSLPSPPSSAPTVATEQTWLAPWRKLINTKRRRDVLFSSFNVKSRQGRVTVHPRYSSYTSLRDALQRDKRFPPLFTVSFYRLFFLRVSPLLAKRSIERRNFITLLEDDVA